MAFYRNHLHNKELIVEPKGIFERMKLAWWVATGRARATFQFESAKAYEAFVKRVKEGGK